MNDEETAIANEMILLLKSIERKLIRIVEQQEIAVTAALNTSNAISDMSERLGTSDE